MMKLPFKFTKQGLLLSGKDREKARIEYELIGEYKDRALLAIDYDTNELKQLKEYKIKKLQIDKKYGKIDDFNYDMEIARLNIDNKSANDVKIDELSVLLKYGKIDKVEFIKRKNDVLEKPWVAIHTNTESEDDDNLEIEVAYNKTFIKKMKARGLPGDTDEEIAEQWLKLFLLANLDEDDLKLLDEDERENNDDKGYVQKKKLNKNSTFIG